MNPPHLALDDKLDLEAILKYVDTTYIPPFFFISRHRRYHANTIVYLYSDDTFTNILNISTPK